MESWIVDKNGSEMTTNNTPNKNNKHYTKIFIPIRHNRSIYAILHILPCDRVVCFCVETSCVIFVFDNQELFSLHEQADKNWFLHQIRMDACHYFNFIGRAQQQQTKYFHAIQALAT